MFRGRRTDGDERRVEATRRLLCQQVLDLVIEDNPDAHRLNPPHFLHEHLARQPIGGNAEVQHASGQRTGVADLHGMPQPCEVISGRETTRSRANHQHALARGRRLDWQLPALLHGKVAQKPLNGVNGDRTVKCASVALVFARVIADPPVDRRKGVVAGECGPGVTVAARTHLLKPTLDVLTSRADLVAGRQEVFVDWPTRRRRPGAPLGKKVYERCHVGWMLNHFAAPQALTRQ